jgi:hypothetical protein
LNSINQFENTCNNNLFILDPQVLPVFKKISKVEEYYRMQRLMQSQSQSFGNNYGQDSNTLQLNNTLPLQPHPPNNNSPDQPRFSRVRTDVMQLDDPSAYAKQIALGLWKEGLQQQIAQKKQIDDQNKYRDDYEDAHRINQAYGFRSTLPEQVVSSNHIMEDLSLEEPSLPAINVNVIQQTLPLLATKIPRPNQQSQPPKKDVPKLPHLASGNANKMIGRERQPLKPKFVQGRMVKNTIDKPRKIFKPAPPPKIDNMKNSNGIRSRARASIQDPANSRSSANRNNGTRAAQAPKFSENPQIISNQNSHVSNPPATHVSNPPTHAHTVETVNTTTTVKHASTVHNPSPGQKSIPIQQVNSSKPPLGYPKARDQTTCSKPPLGYPEARDQTTCSKPPLGYPKARDQTTSQKPPFISQKPPLIPSTSVHQVTIIEITS